MSYWHYEDGTPAPPFQGRFDPSHLLYGLPFIILGALLLLKVLGIFE